MRDSDELNDRKASHLKSQGNALFTKGKYSAAAELYTDALVFCPQWTVLLLNRALCNRKLHKWDAVEADCQRVLALDSESIKGHYYLGLAMQHQLPPRLQQAAKHLHKAMEHARQQGDTIKDNIWKELAKVKFALWEHEHAERAAAYQALHSRLEAVLRTSGAEPDVVLLGEVFDAVGAADEAKDPPSSLVCPLTMTLFRDPVCTPSGMSYERVALLEHLAKH